MEAGGQALDNGHHELSEYEFEDGYTVFSDEPGSISESLIDAGIIKTGNTADPANGDVLIWPCNLMGKARVELQLDAVGVSNDENLQRQFGLVVIYLALVIYTLLFVFRYAKRLIMLAFLTMIAPLMAMTYPLDKLHDGNAQGFNMWLKEYIFNLLIQPVHLILYTVLIGSAMDLVVDNYIYALVALGFILQAEKIMRKFFGFEKASTLAGGSALGGALAMTGVTQLGKLLGRNKKDGKGDKDSNDNSGSRRLQQNNRTADPGHNQAALADDLFGESSSEQAPQTNAVSRTSDQGPNSSNNSQGQNPSDNSQGQNTRDEAMERYNNEGYGTNENGEYYNPWTDEYDPNYDPHNDKSYNGRDGQVPPIDDRTSSNSQQQDESLSDNDALDKDDGFIGPPEAPLEQRGLLRYARDRINDRTDGKLDEASAILRNKARRVGESVTGAGRKVGNYFNDQGQKIRVNGKRFLRNHPMAMATLNSAKSVGRGISKAYNSEVGKSVRYFAPRAAGAAAKLAVKGTLIGAGAVTGLAAGLVSDDFSNVSKYTLAGGGSGLLAGSGITNVPNRINRSGNRMMKAAERQYEATHTAEEIKIRKNAQLDAEFRRDKEKIEKYQKELKVDRKTAKEIMKTDVQAYRNEGITDDDIIIKAMKSEQFTTDRASKERIFAAKTATEVKNQKDWENVQKGLKARKVDDATINKYRTAILKDIHGIV